MNKWVAMTGITLGLTLLLAGGLEESCAGLGGLSCCPDNSKDVAPGESLPGEPNLIGDALIGWRVKEDNRQFGVPDMTHVNSRGLRNAEISLEPKDDHRILIVGDSSIYEWCSCTRSREYFRAVAGYFTKARSVVVGVERRMSRVFFLAGGAVAARASVGLPAGMVDHWYSLV